MKALKFSETHSETHIAFALKQAFECHVLQLAQEICGFVAVWDKRLR